ncbi:MAG TPA: response regulator transcription factor [Micropepsaceae bacterium]|nr:response regulator transcription factor [Micropepsaceae bacterium]
MRTKSWEPNIRILLVEDDPELARRLSDGLRGDGFVVEHAAKGETGFDLGRTEDYDAVILDLGLPDMKGVDVLRQWRKLGREMPVLILTARGSWTEKVEGLNAGADDYITKPSHVQEISARLRALIRRSAGKASPVLEHNDITLNPASGSVTVAGKAVDLTAQEFRILNYFMHRQGRVISQNELIEHLYPLQEERDPNTIEVYIGRLRRKLGRDSIKTLRGLGYRFG